jgi:transposase-like protein
MEKGQKFERRTYTKEFKLEAVRLVRSGIPKARVARDSPSWHVTAVSGLCDGWARRWERPRVGSPTIASCPHCKMSLDEPMIARL